MFIFFSDPSVAVGTGPFKPGLDKEILLENKRLQTQLARLGGKADPSTLTADESSEAKFMSKLEKDNELLFNDNRTLLEENQTLMREIERLKQGRPATDSPLSGVDGAGSIFNSLRGGPDNSQAPSPKGIEFSTDARIRSYELREQQLTMENETLCVQKQDLEDTVQKLRDEMEMIRTLNPSFAASSAASEIGKDASHNTSRASPARDSPVDAARALDKAVIRAFYILVLVL